MNIFDVAMDHVLSFEGGLVDHARDPGGRTNMGITQKKLNEFRAAHITDNLPITVDTILRADAVFIYRSDYWKPLRCDDLPPALAIVAVDAAINAGVGRATRWLQQALRVKADGVIGSKTIAAARAADVQAIVAEFNSLRAWHYMLQDDIDDDFGLGWARRLFATHNLAMSVVG